MSYLARRLMFAVLTVGLSFVTAAQAARTFHVSNTASALADAQAGSRNAAILSVLILGMAWMVHSLNARFPKTAASVIAAGGLTVLVVCVGSDASSAAPLIAGGVVIVTSVIGTVVAMVPSRTPPAPRPNKNDTGTDSDHYAG